MSLFHGILSAGDFVPQWELEKDDSKEVAQFAIMGWGGSNLRGTESSATAELHVTQCQHLLQSKAVETCTNFCT